jgi:hypothetical protein
MACSGTALPFLPKLHVAFLLTHESTIVARHRTEKEATKLQESVQWNKAFQQNKKRTPQGRGAKL